MLILRTARVLEVCVFDRSGYLYVVFDEPGSSVVCLIMMVSLSLHLVTFKIQLDSLLMMMDLCMFVTVVYMARC